MIRQTANSTSLTGAEEAASSGGMMSHPLDLSYMGIYTIWTNKLGKFLACAGRTHAPDGTDLRV